MRAPTFLSVCGLAASLCAFPLSTTSLSAQTRDELIRQAQQHYDNFETEPALNNLKTALDPTRGPRDSLWGQAVHLLAQIYVEEGNPDLARSWLRWAMRLNPDMRVDAALFLPEVVDASDAARTFVRTTASAGDSVVETSWEWPLGRTIQNAGQIRIQPSNLNAPIRVLVGGRPVDEGRTVTLDPGSYDIQAAAAGYRTVRIEREVLPNVTTVLQFNLEPLVVATRPEAAADTALPDAIATRARQDLVKLDVRRFGSTPECRVGFVAGRTYLVTTYDAIRGADSVDARFPDGAFMSRGIRVAAYDTDANVAVLKLPMSRSDSLVLADDVAADQTAWSLSYQNCSPATQTSVNRTSVVELGPPLRMDPVVPGGAYGGALIDRSGLVLGMVRTPQTAVTGDAVRAVLEEARRNDPVRVMALADVARTEGLAPAAPAAPPAAPPQVAQDQGGGFPIAIVLGGVAAAGAGAAVLLLGGGDKKPQQCPAGTTGTYPDCTDIPTTGSIGVSVPNRSIRFSFPLR